MRIHEGEFAYDIEPQRDPSTQLLSNWKFSVYRLRPVETLINRGERKTREEAETEARKAIETLRAESGRAA